MGVCNFLRYGYGDDNRNRVRHPARPANRAKAPYPYDHPSSTDRVEVLRERQTQEDKDIDITIQNARKQWKGRTFVAAAVGSPSQKYIDSDRWLRETYPYVWDEYPSIEFEDHRGNQLQGELHAVRVTQAKAKVLVATFAWLLFKWTNVTKKGTNPKKSTKGPPKAGMKFIAVPIECAKLLPK
jgi:hypothetical protein